MSDTMRVAAIVDERKVEVRSVRKATAGRGQVLINIKACALCTWEQRAFTRVSKMPLPFVGGHEIAGVIAGLGEGVKAQEYPLGAKVAVRLLHACGKCYFCRRGEENLCVEINNLDDSSMEIPGTGGLGEYLAVEPSQVYFLPQGLSYETAVFSEPLACVLNSIEKGAIEMGDDVVVLGGGIMGMLHVLCAKRRGARVILSEPMEARRKIALELGADLCIDPTAVDPVKAVKEFSSGRGAEAVFDTTPIASVAQQAVAMTADMGRCVMYSSMHPDKPIEVSPNWLHKSETIITGAVSPSVRSFARSVNMLSKGLIDPSRLVSGVFELDKANSAFEAAVKPENFRIIVKM